MAGYIKEMFKELSAAATLARLEELNIDVKDFRNTASEALVKMPPKTAKAVKKFIKIYAETEAESGKNVPSVDKYFDNLERQSKNLERRSKVFKSLYGKTTTWVAEMASFAVVFKGLIDLSNRAGEIQDIDIQATGELKDVMKSYFSVGYEEGSIIAKKYNVDAKEVAKSAYEFVHWFHKEPEMKDLEHMAAMARTMGTSYETVWRSVTKRQGDLNETFEEASYGVQDILVAQHDLEVYQHRIGIPRENILGAKDFADAVTKITESTDKMPKDSKSINHLISETLKRAKGVSTKEGQISVAEDMIKVLEANPQIKETMGEKVDRRISDTADKILSQKLSEGKKDYDRSAAEEEAIDQIFGKAYSAQVKSLKKLQKEGLDKFNSMLDLGEIYSKTPEGMRDTLRGVQEYLKTVGGNSGQLAQEFFEQRGVNKANLPEFIRMSMDGKLAEIGDAAFDATRKSEANLKEASRIKDLTISRASPAAGILGTVRGIMSIIADSPFTKIIGGLAALGLVMKFTSWQDKQFRLGMMKVTKGLVKIARKKAKEKGVKGVRDLLPKTQPIEEGAKGLGGFFNRPGVRKAGKIGALLSTVAGVAFAGYELLPSLKGLKETTPPEIAKPELTKVESKPTTGKTETVPEETKAPLTAKAPTTTTEVESKPTTGKTETAPKEVPKETKAPLAAKVSTTTEAGPSPVRKPMASAALAIDSLRAKKSFDKNIEKSTIGSVPQINEAGRDLADKLQSQEKEATISPLMTLQSRAHRYEDSATKGDWVQTTKSFAELKPTINIEGAVVAYANAQRMMKRG